MQFILTEKQEIELTKWLKTKDRKNFKNSTIGGHYEYIFTPHSLGVTLIVKCLGDDTEINLTDYDNF